MGFWGLQNEQSDQSGLQVARGASAKRPATASSVLRRPTKLATCTSLSAFAAFITDGRWKWGTKHRLEWVALAVEFVATYGLFKGICDHEMTVGVFVRRFKDVFLQILSKHCVAAEHIVGIRHMKSIWVRKSVRTHLFETVSKSF